MAYSLSHKFARVLLLSILVASAVGTFGAPAYAGPSKNEIKQFKKHVASGSKHYDNKQFEQALEAFRRAQEIANPPSLRYNIARTLQSLGRCRDAKETLESFLSVEDLSKAKRRKGKKRLSELDAQCPARATLELDCRPSDAEVTVEIDGRAKSCPAEFSLTPGTHTAEFTAPGFRDKSEEFEVESGESVSGDVDLVKRSTEPPSDSGGAIEPASPTFLTQIGGMAIGAGLLGGGIASDLGTNARLQNLADAAEARDPAEIQRLRDQASSARTRTIVLYSTGAALAVGSAVWMTIDLTSESAPGQGVTLELDLSPRSIAGTLRW